MLITSEHKQIAKRNFDGSIALFEVCWRKYLQWLDGAIDEPENQSNIDNWLKQIASERVNNPRSTFYIYG